MSVIVKGMNLPKSCNECRFSQKDEFGVYAGEDPGFRCVACYNRLDEDEDGRLAYKRRRPDYCPLVFVMGV